MQVMGGLCRVMLVACLVSFSDCADTAGCQDWSLESGEEVCCTRCGSGNRLVKRCGRDPKELCTPCGRNSYTTDPLSPYCKKCTQCTGPQYTLKSCTISSDTVCTCNAGYLCGDEKCSFCVTECKKGEEPTKFRSCKACANGTFNDQIHSMCRTWRTSCPVGQIIERNGNALKDHECRQVGKSKQESEIIGLSHIKPDSNRETPDNNVMEIVVEPAQNDNEKHREQINWVSVAIPTIVIAVFAVFCIIASVTACVQARRKNQKKLKPETADEELSEDSRNMIVEQEACSFHHPEQEQGGSSESISTQDSETKLIV